MHRNVYAIVLQKFVLGSGPGLGVLPFSADQIWNRTFYDAAMCENELNTISIWNDTVMIINDHD